jgi:hypothetical protein
LLAPPHVSSLQPTSTHTVSTTSGYTQAPLGPPHCYHLVAPPGNSKPHRQGHTRSSPYCHFTVQHPTLGPEQAFIARGAYTCNNQQIRPNYVCSTPCLWGHCHTLGPHSFHIARSLLLATLPIMGPTSMQHACCDIVAQASTIS